MDLFRATRMEVLKLRRTLALWASLLAPLLVIVMTTGLNLFRNIGGRFDPGAGPNVVPWDAFMLDLVLFLWCLIGLPLFVSLEAALLAAIEHRENAWKHLFALPIPRWTIYVSKLFVASGLICVTSFVLTAGIGIEGEVLLTTRPDLGLIRPIPWLIIFGRSFAFAPTVLFMLALQTWVATRWRSFTVPMSLAIAATVAGIMMLRSLRTFASNPGPAYVASVFPWSLPYVTIARQATPILRTNAFFAGVVGGALVAALGCWDFIHRDAP
jgi:hypothetical protein